MHIKSVDTGNIMEYNVEQNSTGNNNAKNTQNDTYVHEAVAPVHAGRLPNIPASWSVLSQWFEYWQWFQLSTHVAFISKEGWTAFQDPNKEPT